VKLPPVKSDQSSQFKHMQICLPFLIEKTHEGLHVKVISGEAHDQIKHVIYDTEKNGLLSEDNKQQQGSAVVI
jgi:hypothetical protein